MILRRTKNFTVLNFFHCLPDRFWFFYIVVFVYLFLLIKSYDSVFQCFIMLVKNLQIKLQNLKLWHVYHFQNGSEPITVARIKWKKWALKNKQINWDFYIKYNIKFEVWVHLLASAFSRVLSSWVKLKNKGGKIIVFCI